MNIHEIKCPQGHTFKATVNRSNERFECPECTALLRIKELKQEAFDTADYPADHRYRIEPNAAFCEKFAELIIEECARIAKDASDRRIPASQYSNLIKAFNRLEP
jgi:hypothetical protein